ncbi:MAG: hypothetical protein OXG67_01565 [bacterium]|nr:hypothetical protein [bacterium]MCY3889263.1 hypothetical protein [bacterium]
MGVEPIPSAKAGQPGVVAVESIPVAKPDPVGVVALEPIPSAWSASRLDQPGV